MIDLVQIARRVLVELGFEPDPPAHLDRTISDEVDLDGVRDLRDLPWSSIDNHDSRDLDQVEVAEALPGGAIRIFLGIADVAAFVPADSPIDRHARINTATLYTPVRVFPMIPRALSEGRTSLLPGADKLAMVTEMIVREDGTLDDRAIKIYRARVRNHAKLIYEGVGAWIEDQGPAPADPAIAEQVALHDLAAQRLRRRRYELGALDFETIEARTVAEGGKIVDLVVAHKNRARELVEDIMIAANGATARFLEQRGFSSIRRVVHEPKRWDKIREVAGGLGFELPVDPSSAALSAFLDERRAKDPARFADLSLTIVKLIGPGEYALQRATDPDTGHFGLAVEDYAHSTAPNRRYPDLVTQRLLQAASSDGRTPYTDEQLFQLAAHCTERENMIRKIERTMRKVAAATLLSSRIGEEFDAIVTGASPKGTYARLLRPAAEGRVMRGERGLDVGDRIRVRLLDTNPERGFIDFEAV